MIGLVVGLQAEARLAQALGCRVAIGGGGEAGAARAAAGLVADGAAALLSFGLAGGLAPGLAPGAVLAPERVIDGSGGEWRCDPVLAARLGSPTGTLMGAPAIVATAAAKSALWRQSGALAVDLESGAVARAAAAAGLGFAVLRVVCDPADRDLPPAALTALDSAGRIRAGALFRSLVGNPGQLAALIRLGRDAASARRALLAQVRRIGPLSTT